MGATAMAAMNEVLKAKVAELQERDHGAKAVVSMNEVLKAKVAQLQLSLSEALAKVERLEGTGGPGLCSLLSTTVSQPLCKPRRQHATADPRCGCHCRAAQPVCDDPS